MALGYRYVPTLYGMQRVATRPRRAAPSVVDSSMGGPVKVTPSNPTGAPGGDPATGAVIGRGGGEFGVPTPGPVIAKGTPLDPTTGLPATGVTVDPITGKWGVHHVPDANALIMAAAAGGIADAQTRRASAIRQALYQYGWDPGQSLAKFTGYGSDVTPEDVAAAQNNPYSVLAGYQHQRAVNQANLEAEVGARGLYSSGAWTGAENEALNAYNTSLGDWGQKLAGALGLAGSNYLSEYGTAVGNAGQQITASGAANPWWEYWSGPTQA